MITRAQILSLLESPGGVTATLYGYDLGSLRMEGSQVWVGGACAALGSVAAGPSLAAEIAAMPPADRAIAERVADLGETEPPEGYVERAVDRARREGVLP